MDRGSLKSPSPDMATLTVEAAHSFLHAAIQQPIDGLSQIADRTLNTSLQSNLQIIDAPNSAEFGSSMWHAQQVGAALGIAADYLLVRKIMKGSTKEAVGKAESVSLSSQVGNAAVSGATYESLFRASDPDQNLVVARLKQGVQGAATFATLTATKVGLGQTFGVGASRIGEVAIGTIAGAPAGVVGAQLSSIMEGKGLASAMESLKSAYTFAVVGGALGALHTVGRTTNSSARDIQLRTSEPAKSNASVERSVIPIPETLHSVESVSSQPVASIQPTHVTLNKVRGPNEVKVRLSDLGADSINTASLERIRKAATSSLSTSSSEQSSAEPHKGDSHYYRFVPHGTISDIRLARLPRMISLENNAEPSIVFGNEGVESIRYPRNLSTDAQQKLQLVSGYARIIVEDPMAVEAASEVRKKSIGFINQEITGRATYEQMQSNAVHGALDYVLGRTGNSFTRYLIERYGPMTPVH